MGNQLQIDCRSQFDWLGLNVVDEKYRLFRKKRDVPHENSASRKRHRDVILFENNIKT